MLRATLAIASTILFTAFGVSAPANAAQLRPSTPLTSLDNCSDGPTFICSAVPSGGTAPYTVTFTSVANATITHHGLRSVTGTCTVGVLSKVDITVTDAVGSQFLDHEFWVCG